MLKVNSIMYGFCMGWCLGSLLTDSTDLLLPCTIVMFINFVHAIIVHILEGKDNG